LNLDYTAVSDKSLDQIAGLTKLRDLSLDTATITDAGAEKLAGMKGLQKLNLYHTLLTDKGYEQLKAALPACEVIYERESALPNRRKS
jgi:hypothetical protein